MVGYRGDDIEDMVAVQEDIEGGIF